MPQSSDKSTAQSILIVPPLGETLNLCRRFLHLMASALSACGHDVIWPDLSATGDSDGDLSTISPDAWVNDLERVMTWHQTHLGISDRPYSILTMQSGTPLAAALAVRSNHLFERFVAIAPVWFLADWYKQQQKQHNLRLRLMPESKQAMLEHELSGYSWHPDFLKLAIQFDASIELNHLSSNKTVIVTPSTSSESTQPVGNFKSVNWTEMPIWQIQDNYIASDFVSKLAQQCFLCSVAS